MTRHAFIAVLLVLTLHSSLRAADTWRRGWDGSVRDTMIGAASVFVVDKQSRAAFRRDPKPTDPAEGDSYDALDRLTCIDGRTGETIWTRRFLPNTRFAVDPRDDAMWTWPRRGGSIRRLDPMTGDVTFEHELGDDVEFVRGLRHRGLSIWTKALRSRQTMAVGREIDLDFGGERPLAPFPSTRSPNGLSLATTTRRGHGTAVIRRPAWPKAEPVWERFLGGSVVGMPVWCDDEVLIVSGERVDHGMVWSLDPESGMTRWAVSLERAAAVPGRPQLRGGSLPRGGWTPVGRLGDHVVAIAEPGIVVLISRNGRVRAKYETGPLFELPSLIDEHVVFPGYDGPWTVPLEVVLSSPSPIAVAREDFITSVMTRTPALLERVETAPIERPLFSAGPVVYAMCEDASFVLLDARRGGLIGVDRVFEQPRRWAWDGDGIASGMSARRWVTPPPPDQRPRTGRPHVPENAPAEWRTYTGRDGPVAEVDGRFFRPLYQGAVRVLDGDVVREHATVVQDMMQWRIATTAIGVMGYGVGGVYRLDENCCPIERIVDVGFRSDTSTLSRREVFLFAADHDAMCMVVGTWSQMTLELRSADGQTVHRELPIRPGRNLAREPERLTRLGDGYLVVAGEVLWIPIDPSRRVWRFDIVDAPLTAPRGTAWYDLPFGLPLRMGDTLFVPNRAGGIYSFSVLEMAGSGP